MSGEVVQTANGAPPAEASEGGDDLVWLDELTPRQIVAELDKYIIGQSRSYFVTGGAVSVWRRSCATRSRRTTSS